MDDIIKTDNLTKHYSDVRAVDGVSLSVKKGEIYGFLGLNGAGKTTTIRMLLGMIRPTTGSAFLFGQQVSADSRDLWEKVGYLVEIPYSYPELTVWENLEIVRRLRGISDINAVETTIDGLKLASYRNRKAKYLSQGNAQRLGLAKALIHKPDVLILDEPTNGLDPAGIVEVRKLFKDLSDHGVTIFISSHILGEVSRLATRIGIIHRGRLLQEVNTGQLERLLRKRLVVDAQDKKAAQAKLNATGYAVELTEENLLVMTEDKAVAHPETVATVLVQSGLPPTLLKVEEEDLEKYFLRMINNS